MTQAFDSAIQDLTGQIQNLGKDIQATNERVDSVAAGVQEGKRTEGHTLASFTASLNNRGRFSVADAKESHVPVSLHKFDEPEETEPSAKHVLAALFE